jgi:hypothetical protein
VSSSAGLEGRSRDRLEDGLAPLDAEGRHDGGGEGALRRRGQSMAHEGGTESSHGEYGVVVSGEWRGGGGGRGVVASQCNAVRSIEAIYGLMRRRQPRKERWSIPSVKFKWQVCHWRKARTVSLASKSVLPRRCLVCQYGL